MDAPALPTPCRRRPGALRPLPARPAARLRERLRAGPGRDQEPRGREHPWGAWSELLIADPSRVPGTQSRWSQGKDPSFTPLRPDRVIEVGHDLTRIVGGGRT